MVIIAGVIGFIAMCWVSRGEFAGIVRVIGFFLRLAFAAVVFTVAVAVIITTLT